MAKYSEQTILNWIKHQDDAEQTIIENPERKGAYDVEPNIFINYSKKEVVNFIKQYFQNEINKNEFAHQELKRLVRLHRKLRCKLIEDGEVVNENITPYLLERLTLNIPIYIINDFDTWLERLKQSIIFLYHETQYEEIFRQWKDISELLYLFNDRKKLRVDVHQYMVQLWKHLGF